MQEKFNQQTKLFSDRLKLALEHYPESKGELAKRLDVSPVTISRWLGGRVPDAVYGNKLARELSVRFNWLIFGEGEMDPVAGMVSEDVVEYAVKPITQTVEDALKNASGNDALDFIESTARFMRTQKSYVRKNFYNQLRLLVDEAEKKDNEPTTE